MKEYLIDHIYGREYEVRYDDIDRNNELKAVSVLNYLEDAALAHSAYLKYPLERLLKDKNVWILTQWAMEMKRYPSFGERFTVETWAYDFSRFRATRNYRLKDEDGCIIGGLSSKWIFFDLSQRKPAKTSEEMKQDYGMNQTRALSYEPDELNFNGVMDSVETLEVRRSDIDLMNHVNNKRFIEWMIEAVPENVYQSRKVRRMEIAYLKEAHFGSPVLSACASVENADPEAVYFHRINSINGETVHAIGKTYWVNTDDIK